MPPHTYAVLADAILGSKAQHGRCESNATGGELSGRVASVRPTVSSWEKYNERLTRFWRRYGVKLYFPILLYTFCGTYNRVVVTDVDASTSDFSWAQTIFLNAFRWTLFWPAAFLLPCVISLLFFRLEGDGYDRPEIGNDAKPATTTTTATTADTKQRAARIVVRIVTRGDYPQLLTDSVFYHEKLFQNCWYRDQDEIQIHVSSERPLNVARPRRNGVLHRCEVKEYNVPGDYRTRNNSMFKARNSQFALEQCVAETRADGLPLADVWTLALDEDTFLSGNWLREFQRHVLDADRGYTFVNSPSRPVFFDDGVGLHRVSQLVPFFGEAFRMALDIGRLWWQAEFFGKGAVGVRGSCYAVRLDKESQVGYDFGGPFLSIGDDTTFNHSLMNIDGARLKYVRGWFLEGAPSSAVDFLRQRARWIRNHAYFLLFSDVSRLQKLPLVIFLVLWAVMLPLSAVTWLCGYLMLLVNGSLIDFYPAGPAWPLMDGLGCVSATCVIYFYIYGSALILPWHLALVVALTFTTYMPVVPLHLCAVFAIFWGFSDLYKELTAGKADFAFTQKDKKE